MSTSEPRGIAGVEKTLFEQVWSIVQQLEEREKHFNDLQARYRTLASTWLLAAFGGIGFVFTKTTDGFPWPPAAMAAAIALAGALGIALLWVLDVLVYHELLIGGYVVGKRLEKKYAWLPPIRRASPEIEPKSHAVRSAIAIFYIAGISVLCLLAAAFCWSCADAFPAAIPLVVAVVLDAIILVMTRHALKRKERLEKQLESWLPERRSPTT